MGSQASRELVFLDFAIDGKYKGRIVFELFPDCPLAVENLKMLCSGCAANLVMCDSAVVRREAGCGRAGKPLCYKGTPIHRIVPGAKIRCQHAVPSLRFRDSLQALCFKEAT